MQVVGLVVVYSNLPKAPRLVRGITRRAGLRGKVLIPAQAWVRVIVVGVFGGAAVMLATMAFSRSPALRVDPAGVAIRPYPLRFSVIAFYPWEDVAQILILRFRDSKGQYGKSSSAAARGGQSAESPGRGRGRH